MTQTIDTLHLAEPHNINDDPYWRQRGSCRGRDPELWFADDEADRSEAVDTCLACPVVRTCLQWAIDTDQQEGIWGGETFPFGPKLACGHAVKHKYADTGHTYRDCRLCNAAYHRERRDRQRMQEAAHREGAVA